MFLSTLLHNDVCTDIIQTPIERGRAEVVIFQRCATFPQLLFFLLYYYPGLNLIQISCMYVFFFFARIFVCLFCFPPVFVFLPMSCCAARWRSREFYFFYFILFYFFNFLVFPFYSTNYFDERVITKRSAQEANPRRVSSSLVCARLNRQQVFCLEDKNKGGRERERERERETVLGKFVRSSSKCSSCCDLRLCLCV